MMHMVFICYVPCSYCLICQHIIHHCQAEHGPDSQAVLVIAGDGVDIKAIEEEISKQCGSLPRGEFASKALSHSFIVFARDMFEVTPLTSHCSEEFET